MKSPLIKSVGEVITDYGLRVMKVFKKGLLQRSLFDFYGEVKADALRTREASSVPSTPLDKEGGIIYTKSADGKLYYKSNEVAEVEISSSGATLTTEQVQDIVGAMFSSNTETNITVTYQDADGTIDLAATDTNTQLTTEEVQDIVGAMFASNTETRISATYQDADGTIDLVVDSIPVDLTSDGAGTIHINNVPTLNQSTTGNAATATLATNSQGIASATDADVNIVSDGEVIVKLDSDNDESNQKFKVTDRADTVVFSVQEDGVISTAGGTISIDGSNSNLEMNAGSDIILEADNAGGSGASSIQYKDSGGGNKIMLSANSDVVILSNRASDGTVQIRANTSTAGSGGEVTVVTVHDDKVDISKDLNVTGIITGKQREVYSQSFLDDLGNGNTHYLPWKDINEQTTIYQEEAAMVMPCDGRIVSVTIRTSSLTGSGNITLGVHSLPPGISNFTGGNWNQEETEALAVSSTDDYHVFHFAFDNAKHFESTEMVSISITTDADLGGTTYWYVTTVVEYDWSTFLGRTSAELDAAP